MAEPRARHRERRTNRSQDPSGGVARELTERDDHTHVFEQFPGLPEGELAKLRAVVVSSETLAQVALELDLGAALRLGKGEHASGGRGKTSILADAMEAVIAAVYLDGGMEPARAPCRRQRRTC